MKFNFHNFQKTPKILKVQIKNENPNCEEF